MEFKDIASGQVAQISVVVLGHKTKPNGKIVTTIELPGADEDSLPVRQEIPGEAGAVAMGAQAIQTSVVSKLWGQLKAAVAEIGKLDSELGSIPDHGMRIRENEPWDR